jgi:hypothetical protein
MRHVHCIYTWKNNSKAVQKKAATKKKAAPKKKVAPKKETPKRISWV